ALKQSWYFDLAMNLTTRFLLAITCLAILTSGCGMVKGKEASDKAVVEFHARYNDGKTALIYSDAASKFKSASAEKEFLDLMAAVQRKLGKATNSANSGFNIRSFNLVTTVVV